MHFIIIARDGSDDLALERRLAARPAHIALGDSLRKAGKHLLGVALLDDAGKMIGSVMLVDFESEGELQKWLSEEPYVTGKVWEQIEVKKAQIGPSFLGLFA